MADNLSLSEAVEFLEDALQLQSPMDKLKEDRVGFLQDAITGFLRAIPFQSVTAIATPNPERRSLTFEEIKVDMMTRQGGLCCEMNYFMKVLLERLGFEVYHVAGSISGKPNNHLATVVKSLRRPGDLHLVDVGKGSPLFSPISLDFDKETPCYEDDILIHQLRRDSDGTFRWMRKVNYFSDDLAAAVVEDKWYTFMVLDLEFRDIEFFADSMENVHTVESGPDAVSPFLVSLRAVDYRNGRLFAIKDAAILEEDDIGKVDKKRVSSPEELLEAYRVHFPQFPIKIVQQSIQTANLRFES